MRIVLLCLSTSLFALADSNSQWDAWIRDHSDRLPVVQERFIERTGRFEIAGPLLSKIERQDFFNTYAIGASARYHFNETHAWEILNLSRSFPVESSLAKEIREKTSFVPDAISSRLQIGSAYVFAPIYGKYAWGSDTLIHFDIYGTLGAGVRFIEDGQQIFGELGLGMTHYFAYRRLSIVPDFRVRFYQEQRSSSVPVLEAIFRVGVAWLI